MKCDIIIPIWNNLEFTRDCVEAITRTTTVPYRLILIDNASDRPTRDYLETLAAARPADVTLIRNGENTGFIVAANQGLRASTAPYICILNNDTIPGPGWLERMIAFARDHRDVGLINPQCDGHGDRPIDEHARLLAAEQGRYMEMNQCHGFCMLFTRELFEKVGYLDEAYGIGGYDDTDYSMRAHVAGYRCVAIRDAYVYHRLHGSFDRSGDRENWVRRNREIYYRKWGKHLRVGIALALPVTDEAAVSRAAALAYGLAREWTWVHLWVNTERPAAEVRAAIDRAIAALGLAPHQNIRVDRLSMPRSLFSLTIAGKMLERLRKRMRDKRFDGIVLIDRAAGWPVPVCGRIVGASVIPLAQGDTALSWQKKGADIAGYLQNRKKEYER